MSLLKPSSAFVLLWCLLFVYLPISVNYFIFVASVITSHDFNIPQLGLQMMLIDSEVYRCGMVC